MYNIKSSFLMALKLCGFFKLSKHIYNKKLRILCYHGFSLKDEELCIPGLFIRPDVFSQRMDWLLKNGYNLITLENAYQSIINNETIENAVVITIDDGFYSFYKEALPILDKRKIPSTLYLTSYYFNSQHPVFVLISKYLFWAKRGVIVSFDDLNIPPFCNVGRVELTEARSAQLLESFQDYGQGLTSEDQRNSLLVRLAKTFEINFKELVSSRMFGLINAEELQVCIDHKVDIELHTHRHDFPSEQNKADEEIKRNKKEVDSLLPIGMSHFCYPSGVWNKEHWKVLNDNEIKTATTCETGLVDNNTPLYAWNRILDSARVSELEFEAEMTGALELIRRIRHKFGV